VARAAWVGIFATALNLLPSASSTAHILYSIAGDWHKWLSRIFVIALVPVAIFYRDPAWLLWACCCCLSDCGTGDFDSTVLDSGRKRLAGWPIIFVLCFMPAPIIPNP